MFCKNGLHEWRGPNDAIGTECRRCYRDRQHRHDYRRRLAMDLLRQIESAGLRTKDLDPGSGFAIALEWINAADDHELMRIEAAHPALIGKLRRRIEAR